jgi:hypothetical protein
LLAVAGAVLITWVFIGPFRLLLPITSPLNAEGILALSFLLLTLLRPAVAGEEHLAGAPLPRFALIGSLAGVIAITGLAFLPVINAPLLHDAYVHVWNAATGTWSGLAHSFFVHPTTRDFFFRPLGDISYRLVYKLAGTNAVAWNLWNLGIHLANTCLVWVLARQLTPGRISAATAALFFGLHGTRPEVVAWVGARFDLLASFFVLAALLALNRYVDAGTRRWYALAGFCAFCAFLSKESAYCLPLLALLLIPFRERAARRRILRGAALILFVCTVVLLYRTWLLNGIGGYRTETGAATIFQFSAVRTIKALLFRQWAILFFPVNWSSGGLALKWAMALMVSGAAAFPVYSNAARRHLSTSLLWVVVAALPVQHLLLIGDNLSGARVLYLPVLGLALFWGLIVGGRRPGATGFLLPAAVLAFQLVALEHNLDIWRGVAYLSQRTCKEMGAELARDSRNVVVHDLPATWNGVYFLKNGFPQCVALNTGQPIDRIAVQEDNPQVVTSARRFSWNSLTGRMEEDSGR